MVPNREHTYSLQIKWSGNLGKGTSGYSDYSRSHEIIGVEKPIVPGSSDPLFRGDSSRYNPEELLVSSLSSCHMLWYLHLCSEADIIVVEYVDNPVGIMLETTSGGGRFKQVILKPLVYLSLGSDRAKAKDLHKQAHQLCFIANSVNFPVECKPVIQMKNRDREE